MAKYVVPPNDKNKVRIIKCGNCKTLYVPDSGPDPWGFFENCPLCGSGSNAEFNLIPLWQYNLIRYWRGLFDREQPDAGRTDN